MPEVRVEGRLLKDLVSSAANALKLLPPDSLPEWRESGARADESANVLREARWLVSSVLRTSPADLQYREITGDTISASQVAAVEKAVRRRLAGEPMAYATGTAAFRELELFVDHRVLIPRPETELVVEQALVASAGHPGGIAVDIGTGSGAIAISLALEGRFDRVIGTDVSADALELARTNADQMTGQVRSGRVPAALEFRLGTDLEPIRDVKARVLVSNPPYIAYGEAAALPASVRDYEPPVALFAADGGMAMYRTLLYGAGEVLESGGWLVLELDSNRAQQVGEMADRAGFMDVSILPDLSGRDRVLVARLNGQRPDGNHEHAHRLTKV